MFMSYKMKTNGCIEFIEKNYDSTTKMDLE